MKHRFLFLGVIIICLTMASCTERQKVKTMMMDFMKTEIMIPDDLECICKREMKTIALDSLKESMFIIYYDSLDCSSCRIGHLAESDPLYEMADTCGFSLLTIFSPRMDDLKEVRLQLMMTNSPIPIYLDVNGSFRKRNSSIPSDLRFHNFFIGQDSRPAFVGNPLASDRLSELFQEVLVQLNIINN